MKKILICGATSFVANGFKELLLSKGYEVDTYGRKDGNYLNIDKSQFLSSNYYAVVNFAVLKDQSVDENIKYLKALVKMCQEHGVKKLIHFSSIMVYNRNNKKINELTDIDSSKNTLMKGYGIIKIATDEYLNSVCNYLPFELIRVRPGFVLASNVPCPFIKHLIGPINIILGNKKSTMPVVRREDIHTALISILENEKNMPVYMFYPNDHMTKYQYAKKSVNGVILCLPKWLFKDIPYFLAKLHILPWSLYSRFEGMFTCMEYSSIETEKKLNIKFQ